jgi:protein TonB
MQLAIETGRGSDAVERSRPVEFVRVQREKTIETRERRPERPPGPAEQPELPRPEQRFDSTSWIGVALAAPALHPTAQVAGAGLGVSDGEYLPIVKVAPVYPTRALARRLEGYVLVEFVVTATGAVRDIVVLESSAPIFEDAAIEAALKFKYKPRIVNGEAIEVRGVQNRIVFEMAA